MKLVVAISIIIAPALICVADNSYTNVIPEMVRFVATVDKSNSLEAELECVNNMIYYSKKMIENVNNRKEFEADECVKKYIAWKVERKRLLEIEVRKRTEQYVLAEVELARTKIAQSNAVQRLNMY